MAMVALPAMSRTADSMSRLNPERNCSGTLHYKALIPLLHLRICF
jgi:hypothetical protein